MFWKFKKKKEVKKPYRRRIYIPKDRCEEFLKAWDEYGASPAEANSLARYKFWILVFEFVQDNGYDTSCTWTFEASKSFLPYLEVTEYF